jgi:hypothetical protein
MKDGSFGAATSRLRRCEKARFALGAMELRMAALGFGWADVTATQVYTIFNIHPLLADEIVRRGATLGGLTWHFARPPVQGRRPQASLIRRRAGATRVASGRRRRINWS